MLKVVGIDPGLAATGLGVVYGRGRRIEGYGFGCITTPAAAALPQRLERLFTRLNRLFAAESPDLVVVEDVFSLQEYPKSGIALGQVSGIVLLAVSQAGLDWTEVPVREAKRVLTGSGTAGKDQLELAVRRRLAHPGPIRPFHASDALGLAIIGFDRSGGMAAAAARHARAAGRKPS
jgi:crossover junction endodeoxyribonuclease RuvC